MRKKIRNTLLIAILLLFGNWLYAQVPGYIGYQAVVRDASSKLVENRPVGICISILQGSETGTAVYRETHSVTTNTNGVMTLLIGNGTVDAGTFSAIDWSSGVYFVKTEIDPTGGTAYSVTSVTQLLSVPYALYAKTSGSSIPGPQGPAGPAGSDGSQGPQGVAGQQGSAGPTGPQGIQGDTGPQGPAGPQGASGVSGQQGVQGLQGAPGFSAYQIWLSNGNTGSEADFLAQYQNVKPDWGAVNGSSAEILNKPDLFSGSYEDLTNKPNIKDSIDTYGFNGNYDNLYNKPDSFSGDYKDLTNKPQGEATGDILYWNAGSETENPAWVRLPKGSHGDVLNINAEGKPEWVNIAKLFVDISGLERDTIWSSAGNNGSIFPSGRVVVAHGGLSQFTITPQAGYGINSIFIDNIAINLTGINRLTSYSYTFDAIDQNHYIHAVFAQKKVSFGITYDNVAAEDASVSVNESKISGTSAEYYTAIGGTVSFSILSASRTGLIVKAGSSDITKEVIKNGYTYELKSILEDQQISITFRKAAKTYSVGDKYPNDTNPEGIVCLTESGGEKGLILHLQEENALWSTKQDVLIQTTDEWDGNNNRTVVGNSINDYPAFKVADGYGAGWYLPAINELLSISLNTNKINPALSTTGNAIPLSSNVYWSSTEKQEDTAWGAYMGSEKDHFYKGDDFTVRAVKAFE
jgi:hypothetical protein